MPPDDYPPQPWRLCGQAYLSAWRVPVAELPALPAGIRPLMLAGYGMVLTAWVDYEPGGVLSYRELMATVAVRGPRGIAASITHIWVDSPASLAGGRALWHIPKDLAEFKVSHGPRFTAAARAGDQPLAEAGFRRMGGGSPVRLPAGFSVLQSGPLCSPVRMSYRPVPARATWTFDADGPLAFLRGRRPLFSLAAADFRMRFRS